MKREYKQDSGKTTLTPETLADERALEYARNHGPLFAGISDYQIRAYLAGYEQATKDMLNQEENK